MKKYLFHAGTYDFNYWVVLGKDTDKIKNWARFQLEDPTWDKDLQHNRGILLTRWNFTPILWLPKKPSNPTEYGTFVHEVNHLVFYILLVWVGMKLTPESEEAFTHLSAKIIKDILTKL